MTRPKAKTIMKRLSLQVPEVLYEEYTDLTGSDISDIEKLLKEAMTESIIEQAKSCQKKIAGLDLAVQAYHEVEYNCDAHTYQFTCEEPDTCPICTAIKDEREKLAAIEGVLEEVHNI